MNKNEPKEGDLKVWWIPQISGKAFEVPVADLKQAALIMDTLARYDDFEYKNRIKPDYSNAGGVMVYEKDMDHPSGFDWCDWYSEDGEDFDEWIETQKLAISTPVQLF